MQSGPTLTAALKVHPSHATEDEYLKVVDLHRPVARRPYRRTIVSWGRLLFALVFSGFAFGYSIYGTVLIARHDVRPKPGHEAAPLWIMLLLVGLTGALVWRFARSHRVRITERQIVEYRIWSTRRIAIAGVADVSLAATTGFVPVMGFFTPRLYLRDGRTVLLDEFMSRRRQGVSLLVVESITTAVRIHQDTTAGSDEADPVP